MRMLLIHVLYDLSRLLTVVHPCSLGQVILGNQMCFSISKLKASNMRLLLIIGPYSVDLESGGLRQEV